jgi:hypothetical protein
MAINFPDSPANGTVFTAGQRSWTWNGRAWQATSVTTGYTGSVGYVGSVGYTGSAATTIPVILQSAAYTLQASDNGGLISITTGGVTIPANILTTGMNVSIFNNSASNQTITQGSGVNMLLAGMSIATTGNRNIAPYGLATVICINSSNNTFAITGAGVT